MTQVSISPLRTTNNAVSEFVEALSSEDHSLELLNCTFALILPSYTLPFATKFVVQLYRTSISSINHAEQQAKRSPPHRI